MVCLMTCRWLLIWLLLSLFVLLSQFVGCLSFNFSCILFCLTGVSLCAYWFTLVVVLLLLCLGRQVCFAFGGCLLRLVWCLNLLFVSWGLLLTGAFCFDGLVVLL